MYSSRDQCRIPASERNAVRRGILALAFELNALLPQAAQHARGPADSQACRDATQAAYQLTSCWEGRFGSFLTGDHPDQ